MVNISLKAARVNAGLTQDEAAKAIGKNKQTLVNWETGRTKIPAQSLFALSDLYKVPVENLRLP